ncbi:HD domain-containing protein [Lysinibacillus sp. 54212]|uniref:HD domain-containing protein n=1 Tax=Lysinibacillus sp. 54212 TaxID=3119829 RepID=UPI002FC8845B
MSLIDNATQYIAAKHEGQYRGGLKVPYSTHLFGVARILKIAGYSEEVVIAGLLHDVLEDTDATEEELRVKFGENILSLVKAVSEPDKSLSWDVRKQEGINQIQFKSEFELAIMLAEKIQNVKSITYEVEKLGEQTWKNFNAGKDKQHWYYINIIEQTKKHHPNAKLLPELEEHVNLLFCSVKS